MIPRGTRGIGVTHNGEPEAVTTRGSPNRPRARRTPRLSLQVIDGLIHVTNPAGSQNFSAGQFGFTPSMTQPPVVIPSNPGIQFTPPPAFTSSAPTPTTSSAQKSNNIDCVVR